eukprot:CAMPEP_0206423798 /NCGR_PEP_ID=MMETSP0324_2-20121206/2872_1 /ASSEMBLY_ACC=CAM_ASM_000836 /TAXON_ID=2866 /ORGANISM="Crypthecodinium cohnii, Strain Seligo" /LENGTH=109 /DNA_ID=CAMNT_0053888381 /DNA_START=341 /DNA_END=669 /DNA_ORIENTATION=+
MASGSMAPPPDEVLGRDDLVGGHEGKRLHQRSSSGGAGGLQHAHPKAKSELRERRELRDVGPGAGRILEMQCRWVKVHGEVVLRVKSAAMIEIACFQELPAVEGVAHSP